MKVTRLSSILTAAIASLAVACGGGGDDDDGGGMVDPEGTHNQYVLSEVSIPENATEASNLALNIDGDEQGRPDNALGMALAAVIAQGGLDIQSQIDFAVNSGDVIILANVQAKSLQTSSGVGTWVFLGDNPSPAPCADENDMTCGLHLDGSGMFDISADSPTDALLVGQIAGGKFSGGPGTVTVELALEEGAPPLALELIGAQAEFMVSATQLSSGVLGGALTEEELNNTVIPAVHDLISEIMTRDCTGAVPNCCDADSTGEQVQDIFDNNPEDCEVTLEEFRTNSLIASLLAPDVDLLDENGNFNPLEDGVKDSVSIGVGFSGVGGSFDLPASIGAGGSGQ